MRNMILDGFWIVDIGKRRGFLVDGEYEDDESLG
jgi:hypothetical protein